MNGEQLKQDMIHNIKSYNKNYDNEWLEQKNLSSLMQLTHPDDRINFKKIYYNLYGYPSDISE